MADIGKVIKGLECCVAQPLPKCEACPYEVGTEEGTCFLMDKMHEDALALLKAQEPVEPVFHANITLESSVWRCGACNVAILFREQNYCHSCGKPVKWDE